MNAPFQNVGIIFFVTIVHVVAIAVYSSRTLPEATVQKSTVIPDVDSLEVMPEQLVSELVVSDADDEPESCLDHLKKGVVLECDSKTVDVVKSDAPQRNTEIPGRDVDVSEAEKATVEDAVPGKVVSEEVVAAEVFKEVPAERWEDSDFAKRVSYPHLDGILGKKSKKLAETKPVPAPKVESGTTATEPAPRSRTFSPIPRS